MTRKIKLAYMHDVLFVKGLGQIKETIDVSGDYKGAEMRLMRDFVQFKHKGHEVLIPITNFKLLVPESDDGT